MLALVRNLVREVIGKGLTAHGHNADALNHAISKVETALIVITGLKAA